MNLAEIKKQLIEKIKAIEDEAILQKILNLLASPVKRPSIEQIFEEAKTQYGETLKRLANN